MERGSFISSKSPLAAYWIGVLLGAAMGMCFGAAAALALTH